VVIDSESPRPPATAAAAAATDSQQAADLGSSDQSAILVETVVERTVENELVIEETVPAATPTVELAQPVSAFSAPAPPAPPVPDDRFQPEYGELQRLAKKLTGLRAAETQAHADLERADVALARATAAQAAASAAHEAARRRRLRADQKIARQLESLSLRLISIEIPAEAVQGSQLTVRARPAATELPDGLAYAWRTDVVRVADRGFVGTETDTLQLDTSDMQPGGHPVSAVFSWSPPTSSTSIDDQERNYAS
jgi:hypothetical protein